MLLKQLIVQFTIKALSLIRSFTKYDTFYINNITFNLQANYLFINAYSFEIFYPKVYYYLMIKYIRNIKVHYITFKKKSGISPFESCLVEKNETSKNKLTLSIVCLHSQWLVKRDKREQLVDASQVGKNKRKKIKTNTQNREKMSFILTW